MSLKSGFFNSVNHDRKYNAEDFARLVNALVTDGIVTTKGEQFMVVPGEGLSVNVKSGFAWFNSTWSMSEDLTPLTLDPADVTRARFDAIVLDIDHTNEIRDNKLMVVKGAPSTSPLKPTLANDEKHHQHALAYVSIPAAATEITAANIDIRVGHDDCPFASGKLEVISVDVLFDAWEAEFTEWFDNLKAQLDDNILTNLQNQINERVKIADKATDADIAAGTPNKWVDAAGVGEISKSTGRLSQLLDSWDGFVWPGTIYKTDRPLYLYDFPWMMKTISMSGFNGPINYLDEEGYNWFFSINTSKNRLRIIKISVSGIELLIDRTISFPSGLKPYLAVYWIHNGYAYWEDYNSASSGDTKVSRTIHFTNLSTFEDDSRTFPNIRYGNPIIPYFSVLDNGVPTEIFYYQSSVSNSTHHFTISKKNISGVETPIVDHYPTIDGNIALRPVIIKDDKMICYSFVQRTGTNESSFTYLFEYDLSAEHVNENIKQNTFNNTYVSNYIRSLNVVGDAYPLGILNLTSKDKNVTPLIEGVWGYTNLVYIPDTQHSLLDNLILIQPVLLECERMRGSGDSIQLVNNQMCCLNISAGSGSSTGYLTSGRYIPKYPNKILVNRILDCPQTYSFAITESSAVTNTSWSFGVHDMNNIYYRFRNNSLVIWSVISNADVYPYSRSHQTNGSDNFRNVLIGTSKEIIPL